MQLKRNKQSRALVWAVWGGFALTLAGFDVYAQDEQETPKEEAKEAATEVEQKAPQQPDTFDLLELRVKGNTMIEKKQLERAIYPFLGLKKNVDTVEMARSTLEELYRTQGYQTVSVDIPEQDVKNGIVYLQVVEGKVSRLRVKDSRYFSLGKIKAGIPELAEGNVPNFPKMQKQLAELGGESPDRKLQPILRAGETPGTLEVDLKVKDELPLHGKIEVNGRNTSTTTRLRTIASMHYDNLWQKFHSASFMYQTSPEAPSEVEVMVGTYALPVFESNKRLALYAVRSASTSQIGSAGALAVIGSGNIFGMRFVNPLNGVEKYSHSFTAGIDYKSFKEDLTLLGSDSLKTPISYMPFMFSYSGNLQGETSLFTMDLNASFSVRGLGNTEQEFADKRYKARSNYLHLGADIDYRHDLPWGMEVNGRIAGQIADSPLISNEQFSIGGSQSVRGYYETQVLADDGLYGSLELFTPRLVPDEWDDVNKLRGLVFVDAGRGWILDALKGNVSQYKLFSAGAGIRFRIWKALQANLDLALPFIKQGTTQSGDPRLHFQITTEF